MDTKQYATIFKALADETRVKVVSILIKEKRCACQILEAFKISQSTLSHHMSLLTKSGLVLSQKDGKWVHYELNQVLFSEIQKFFNIEQIKDIPCVTCK